MKITFILIALIILMLIVSCNTTEPPQQNNSSLKLALADTSCTEVWLKLTTKNVNLPAELTIMQDSSVVQTISLSRADTILYVDSLLPNHTYKFHTSISDFSRDLAFGGQPYNHTGDLTSDSLNVTTMDTTSHNFTFQTWTFGGTAGSSTLNDCVIISPENIWCVGEIYVADTSQNGYTLYNAVHWDGNNWTTKRIQTIFRGNLVTVPLTGIFAFSSTDIWVIGSLPIHGDGQNWTMYDLRSTVDPNLSLLKVWGKSTNDIYFVGNSGSIAHYQNRQWSRIESGTDLNINDIYGAYNQRTDQYKILAPASNVLQSLDIDLLSINGNSIKHNNTAPITGTLRTVWFVPGKTYFLGGGGIFRKASLADSLWVSKHNGVTIYSTNRIRGNGSNDIVLTGGYGEVLHYNGYDFKSYISQTQVNGNYYSIDIKDNIIAVVGEDGPKAAITIGRRNETNATVRPRHPGKV